MEVAGSYAGLSEVSDPVGALLQPIPKCSELASLDGPDAVAIQLFNRLVKIG